MPAKHIFKKAIKQLTKTDFYLIILSIALITIGSSWFSDELNHWLFNPQETNFTALIVGAIATIAGIWIAKTIAHQLSRPNPDTFKYFKPEEKLQKIKETQLVIMGLSTLADEKNKLSQLQSLDWSTLCSTENLKISWQQNIRTINTFTSLNDNVKFIVLCSKESASLFPQFKKLIERLERETGQKIHLEQAKETVDVNSIASCSTGIKKVLKGHASEQVVIDITSATKQYSAACTLETTYRKTVYLGYLSNDAHYFIYNVLNEERGELKM